MRTGQADPRDGAHSGLLDGALAGALVGVGIVTGVVWARPATGMEILAVLVPLGLAVLARRRRAPLVVAVVVGATVIVEASLTTNSGAGPLMVAVMLASYSVGAYGTGWTPLAGAVVGVATTAGASAVSPPSGYSVASSVAFFGVLLALAPMGAGRIVRSRRALAERLRAVSHGLEVRGREDQSVEKERARLGRSLEATALAGLDAMASHAEVSSLEDVEAVEGVARDTLGKLRRLLVSLRHETDPVGVPLSVGELRGRVEAALATGYDTAAGVVPGRWTMLPERSANIIVWVLASVNGAGMIASSAAHPRPSLAASIALSVAMAVAVAALRRYPLGATVAIAAATVGYSAAANPVDPLSGLQPTAALILGPFALGAAQPQKLRGALGLAVCLGVIPAVLAADPVAHPHPGSLAPAPALALGVFVVGAVLQARSRTVATLGDTTLRLNAERAEHTAAVLRSERARVARELHDALAHSLTAILMQATAARRVWDTNPDLAAEHAANLRATLAETGGELRQLILTLSIGETAEVALAHLPVLVERARASGMDVQLRVVGEAHAGHGPEDLAGYRIVQEALTNAARHAPGAKVSVEVTYRPAEVSLRVTNGPPLAPAWQINGAGHGLQGMRERARSCGGRLEAGPAPEGGYVVSACLPMASGA